jgi:hypothetical protein
MIRRRWPDWWEWELELSPHLLKRMIDRGFSEVDLRAMLGRARDYRPDVIEGRWIIEASLRKRQWEIIVEPDLGSKRLVVITAYTCWEM